MEISFKFYDEDERSNVYVEIDSKIKELSICKQAIEENKLTSSHITTINRLTGIFPGFKLNK